MERRNNDRKRDNSNRPNKRNAPPKKTMGERPFKPSREKNYDEPLDMYEPNEQIRQRPQNLRNRQGSDREPRVANVVEFKSNEPRKKIRTRRQAMSTRDFIILSISLVLFFISVGGSLFSYFNRKEISTTEVPYGSIDVPKVLNGVIVRDEHVYTADVAGKVEFVVSDKEKVKSGATICTIKDPEETKLLEAEALKKSKEILEIQEQRSDLSVYSADVANYNSKIKNDIDKRLFNFTENDYKDVYKLKEEISITINKRNSLLLNDNKGSVETFVNENKQYNERLTNSIAKVETAEGGVISFAVDGYESIFDVKSLDKIRPEETKMKITHFDDSITKNVSQGEDIFKVVRSNEWYIVSYISNELIKNWQENSKVSIYIDRDGEYEKLEVEVDKLEPGPTESLVILRSNKQILDYLDMRSISFKTYDSIYSGIKIPENAITERAFLKIPNDYTKESSGREVIYKLVNDKVKEVVIFKKNLRIKGDTGGFTYIMQDFDNIKSGDIIVNPNDSTKTYVIEETVTSKGVFKGNSGIATFTSITTDGMIMGSNGYVILSSENEVGIKAYDIVVSDAVNNNINEGDKIN